MTRSADRRHRLNYAIVGIAILIAVLAFARFLHLAADYPVTASSSGAVFTDEGWYANAAVRFVTGQPWYQTGDFNPAVSMPLGQLLDVPLLKILGLGIETVRLVPAVSVLIIIGLMASIARDERENWGPGLLTAALIAGNYQLFVDSRLATTDPFATALATCALFFALRADRALYLGSVLAGVFATLAVLAKASLIFAVPVTMLAVLTVMREPLSRRVLAAAITGALPALAVLAMKVVVAPGFQPDILLFYEINVTVRMVGSPLQWLRNVVALSYHFFRAYPPVMIYSVLVLGASVIWARSFWRSRTVMLLAAWVVLDLGLLSLNTYHPTRYFLPLVAPLAALSVLATYALLDRSPAVGIPAVCFALLGLAVVVDGARIGTYLATPRYSWRDAMLDIGRTVATQSGGRPLLAGNFADTIALETGVPAVNSVLVTEDAKIHLRNAHPTFAVVLDGPDTLLADIAAGGGTTTAAGNWQVYASPDFPGRQVSLYEVAWP